MHPIIVGEIAAQRIAVPRQLAGGQRLVGQFRAVSPVSGRVRAGWVRISFRGTQQVAG